MIRQHSLDDFAILVAGVRFSAVELFSWHICYRLASASIRQNTVVWNGIAKICLIDCRGHLRPPGPIDLSWCDVRALSSESTDSGNATRISSQILILSVFLVAIEDDRNHEYQFLKARHRLALWPKYHMEPGEDSFRAKQTGAHVEGILVSGNMINSIASLILTGLSRVYGKTSDIYTRRPSETSHPDPNAQVARPSRTAQAYETTERL